MAILPNRNVSLTYEEHQLLTQLREKLREKTGIRNISLAEAATIAIKDELEHIDTKQQT